MRDEPPRESVVECVAAALDAAIHKWQPGDKTRIREVAAKAAISAYQDYIRRHS